MRGGKGDRSTKSTQQEEMWGPLLSTPQSSSGWDSSASTRELVPGERMRVGKQGAVVGANSMFSEGNVMDLCDVMGFQCVQLKLLADGEICWWKILFTGR